MNYSHIQSKDVWRRLRVAFGDSGLTRKAIGYYTVEKASLFVVTEIIVIDNQTQRLICLVWA